MLVAFDEPLVLADGTKIDPSTGKQIKDKSAFIEVPSPSTAQALVIKARKTVAELPLPPAQMSSVGLVAFYTLFGLPDKEISIALDGKLSVMQIANIRELGAYSEFMEAASVNLMSSATNQVRELFTAHAHDAATRVINTARDGDNEVLAFKAAQDILDRAGHRPADIVEHRHKMDAGALRIIHEIRQDSSNVPMLDITPIGVDDNA